MQANIKMFVSGVRVVTICLGAVPATAVACLAFVIGLLSESSDSTRLLLLSPLGAVGALALWVAGLGRLPVLFWTAVGLTFGIGATISYSFESVQIDAMFVIFLVGPFLWLLNPWILFSPVVIAAGHLLAAISRILFPDHFPLTPN